MKRSYIFLLALSAVMVACNGGREDLIGTYSVSEQCDTLGDFLYNMEIRVSLEDLNGVIITGFAGLETVDVTASVTEDQLTVPLQKCIIGNDTLWVSGTGLATGNSITFDYALITNAGNDHCIMDCTKQ